MTLNETLLAAMENLFRQWQADTAKKPSITPTQRVNLMIGTFNAMYAAGVMASDPGIQPADVWSIVTGGIDDAGFQPEADLLNANEWGATWPEPYLA